MRRFPCDPSDAPAPPSGTRSSPASPPWRCCCPRSPPSGPRQRRRRVRPAGARARKRPGGAGPRRPPPPPPPPPRGAGPRPPAAAPAAAAPARANVDKGGTVKIGLNGEINNLNPFSVNEIYQGDVLGQVYSSLVKYDNKGNIIGDLAESYDASSDARTWTFKLRSNVKWHDGQQFSSKHVPSTFHAIIHPQLNPLSTPNSTH